ncbi:hypothetical protein DRN98_04080 [Methanosarcinales archaeon]|nr:MAG: hypothetical protein DRN98_04080 [Methanosarcinales archaeon]
MDDSAQGTEEGRGKLRNVLARRTQPLNQECLNGTSCLLASREGEEPGEVKRHSTQRKRNQKRCRKYQREKAAQGKLNPQWKHCGDVVFGLAFSPILMT